MTASACCPTHACAGVPVRGLRALVTPLPALALLVLLALLTGAALPARAQDAPAAAQPAASAPLPPPDAYSAKGADTCLECHDEEADTDTFTTAGVFRTRHALRGEAHTPFGKGGLQCEACHGPGARHSAEGADRKATIISHKANSPLPPAQRNEPCLACHRSGARTGWHAGAHERADLACTSCHQVHKPRDAVLSRDTQPEVCLSCHRSQRADFQKPSSHPVRAGRMACSDCHDPHGSTQTALLVKPTLNQTCTSCHAEKRGPVLWEHAPVAEDCSLCHTAHGSVREALLNKPAPQLCQQCHARAGHPSVARTADGLPAGGTAAPAAIFQVAGSCTNCHSQVHGSNHPAGAKLMR